jgi:hypothetical protein
MKTGSYGKILSVLFISINAAVAQTKAQAGLPVSGTNFRSDVTASGTINSSAVTLVKSHSGAGVP